MIHGRNLILAIGGQPLAGSKSCSVDCQQSFIPTASPTSGRWTECYPDRLNWKITSEGLHTTAANYNTLLNAWRNGTMLTIRYYDSTYGINQTGNAYIENLSINGAVGSLTRCSVSLRGNGSLSNYSGEVINPTVEIAYQDAYYLLQDGKAFYTVLEDTECKLLELQVNKLTRINVNPGGYTVMVTHNEGIYQPFFNQDDFSPAYYGCTVFTPPGDILLQPGINYLIYTTSDDGADSPIITNLGS
jgi:hypothetical protein